ncbi:IclR family transcriptional regulator [Saccharopolyspora erythraea]|nr:IclR family transcriptional regulator [Saccharopolyspora erythraea]
MHVSAERKPDGSQTLERGLRVLRMLAESPGGLGASEVAARLDVHRSVAYRLLMALTRQNFVSRDEEGRYRVGLDFFTLAERVRPRLLDVATPVLRELTAELNATACLVVPENGSAVAVAVIEPPGSGPRFSYGIGNRDPLERGAAGIALLAAGSPRDGEQERVATTRRDGHVVTHEEVVPGSTGIAAPIHPAPGGSPAAINIITHRRDLADRAIPVVVSAARRISEALGGEPTTAG